MMSRGCLAFLFLLGLFGPAMLYGQPVISITDAQDQHIFAFHEIEFMEDPSNKLTVHDVTQPAYSSRFQPSAEFNPTNFNKSSAYWHRITIRHNDLSARQWILEFFDQTIDSIEFYSPDGQGQYIQQSFGDRYAFAHRALWHKNFIVHLDNSTSEIRTYYFRVRSQQRADVIVVLRAVDWLFHYALDEYFFFGIFYGMLLVFSFYNLLMYLAVRESHYVLYVLYLVSIGMFEMSADGIGYQYLWPNAPGWNQYAAGFAQYAASCLSLFFTISLLNLRQSHSILYRVAIAAFLLRTIYLLLSLTFFQAWFTFKPVEFIPLGVGLYIGVRCLLKGYRYARFIVVGYAFLFFGIVTKVLLYFGFNWMPYGQLSHYSLGFSFIMEMIFLSFAMSDKIRLLRVEKAEAQERTIEQLRVNQQLKDNLNEELEQQVKVKTAQLVQKTELVEQQNHQLEQANQQLAEQAAEIAAMNALLTKDNVRLQHDVAEVKEARILSKEVDFEEFSAMYPDDESCLKFLADIKWHNGYACRKCAHTAYGAGRSPHSRRCSKCGYDESVTAYTMLQNTRLPINKAFYMIFLVYSSKGNISSHKLSEILGIRQSTCWTYSAKIKKSMKERRRQGGLHHHEGWNSILMEEN